MENADIAQWLMENAGPVIRYRLSKGHDQDGNRSIVELTELLASPLVSSWLDKDPERM